VTTPSPGIFWSCHAEVDAAVLDEHVPLFEGAFVQQQLQPLARGELALVVLGVDALLPTAQAGQLALGFELFEDVVHGCPSFRSEKWVIAID